MRVPTSLAIVCASTLLATAADKGVVKLEAPPPAEWVTVQADPVLTTLSAPAAAKWVLVDDGPACELRPSADGKAATFAATSDGHYRVLVISGDDVFRVKVVKGGGDDDRKPKPTDPLVKLLQTAFDLDTRTADAKRHDLLDLVELYRQAGMLALDANITTTGQLVVKVRDAAKALGVVGLAEVRKAIGAELTAVFPEDVPLTAESRAKAAATFGRIKAALEGVK